MSASQNLLVELFVEELPPKALKKLGAAFADTLSASLAAQGLCASNAAVTPFATPRRLAVHIENVAAQAPDKAISQKLMPVAVGLDASGNATPALLKKLAALGADASAVASLKRAPDSKAEALFFDSIVQGASLAAGLQIALDATLAKLPIPKLMSYQLADGWTSVNFVRPAHSLIALHGAAIIPVATLGLQSGRSTLGHRFEALISPVLIDSADSYAMQLEAQGNVTAGFDKRRALIASQLQAAASKLGLKAIEDDALLDEVTGLVERPNVLACAFEPEFLSVPQECLILTMKANQKYFPLLDGAGKLTHQFLIVSNITPADPSRVIQGNERVVRPRLADAKFFFDQDRKKSLASRIPALDKVVYHNKLGTQGERTLRVMAIAKLIAGLLGNAALAEQATLAAQLAKGDLVSDMVGEFPELQGTMGRYYALNDGHRSDVADAIEDHYKPRFAGDTLPRGEVGVVVALADKLETLVGLFGIGSVPTGDKDPFALRRHALGVIRLLIERDLSLKLNDLISESSHAFVVNGSSKISSDMSALKEFVYERLAGNLREQGYSVQEVDAVLSLRPQRLSEVPRRLAAVRAFAALPEAPALAAANKRVTNILKKAEGVTALVTPTLLVERAEKSLFEALQIIAPKASAALSSGKYTEALLALSALKAPVDAFFEGVMVNADDPALRANRLGLLMQLHAAMNGVADVSKLAA